MTFLSLLQNSGKSHKSSHLTGWNLRIFALLAWKMTSAINWLSRYFMLINWSINQETAAALHQCRWNLFRFWMLVGQNKQFEDGSLCYSPYSLILPVQIETETKVPFWNPHRPSSFCTWKGKVWLCLMQRKAPVFFLFYWLTSTIYRFSPWLNVYQSLFALQYVLYNPLMCLCSFIREWGYSVLVGW